MTDEQTRQALTVLFRTFDIHGAAEAMGVSLATVYRWAKGETLPRGNQRVKLGRLTIA